MTLWTTSAKVVVAVTALAGIVTMVFAALSELDSRHAPAKETKALIMLVATDLGVVKAERNLESARRSSADAQYWLDREPHDKKAINGANRADALVRQREGELIKAQDK